MPWLDLGEVLNNNAEIPSYAWHTGFEGYVDALISNKVIKRSEE